MNPPKEKLERRESIGFQGLSPETQHLILEQVQKKFEGVPIDELPVEELRRLRDKEFRGKSFSHAFFFNPEKALRHIRGALSHEIDLKDPNPQEVASYMGHLIQGMDPDDVEINLELLRNGVSY